MELYLLAVTKEFKKKDVSDDKALQQILKIQPKTYGYKDVINRGTKRFYGFTAQKIAEVTPEAASVQKWTLYDIYKNLNVMRI
jgi:hypothetical protein